MKLLKPIDNPLSVFIKKVSIGLCPYNELLHDLPFTLIRQSSPILKDALLIGKRARLVFFL